VGPFHGADGDVWRISVKPTDAPVVAAHLAADEVVFDWGGGLIWARVPAGKDVRAAIGPLPGHATIVRASAETRAALGVLHPDPAPVAVISAGLRARFDPRGVLNSGRAAA